MGQTDIFSEVRYEPPPEKEALKQVATLLGKAVSGRPARPSFLGSGAGADARILAGGREFLVEWKSSGDAAAVGSAVRQLRSIQNGREHGARIVSHLGAERTETPRR